MNNLTADVIDFASSRSFEQFKASTDLLNKLDSYPQLLQRTSKTGTKYLFLIKFRFF